MYLTSAMFLLACSFPAGDGLPKRETVFKTGHIRVFADQHVDPASKSALPYYYLMRGDVNFGLNYRRPKNAERWGDPKVDFSRMATTYYHRLGPAGQVMQKMNWFRPPTNHHWADARLPASLVGMGSAAAIVGAFPADQIVDLWSEPPYGVISLHLGTMASYARPYQTVHFYEANPRIIQLSEPKKGPRYFHYIHDAKKRGAAVQILEGPFRKTFDRRAPKNFYHVLVVQLIPRSRDEDIATDFMTKEALTMFMERMTEKGIICFHTSNRYIDMVPVLADVAKSLGFAAMVGQDFAGSYFTKSRPEYLGHFQSEWVMIARKEEYLQHLQEPKEFTLLREQDRRFSWLPKYWEVPRVSGDHVWTDKSPHLVRGILRGDPMVEYVHRLPMYVVTNYLKLGNRRAKKKILSDRTIDRIGGFRALNFAGSPTVFLRQWLGQTVESMNRNYSWKD